MNEKARPQVAAGQQGPEVAKRLEEKNSCGQPGTQEKSRRLLIGEMLPSDNWFRCCPYARTMEAYSRTLNREVVIAIGCKRWGCRYCGEKKTVHLAHKVTAARPNRMVTLTTWTQAYETPRIAYDKTRRAVTQLATRIRRRYSEFEYFRVLERHQNGYPHYHLLVRSPYIPQKELSTLWAELALSKIVHVTKIKNSKHVFKYVLKYLAKQKYIPWTNRRISQSKKFFAKDDWEPPQSLDLEMIVWSSKTPAQHLWWGSEKHAIEELSPTMWGFIHPNEEAKKEIRKEMQTERNRDKSDSQGQLFS